MADGHVKVNHDVEGRVDGIALEQAKKSDGRLHNALNVFEYSNESTELAR
jgi:hypothetical protein